MLSTALNPTILLVIPPTVPVKVGEAIGALVAIAVVLLEISVCAVVNSPSLVAISTPSTVPLTTIFPTISVSPLLIVCLTVPPVFISSLPLLLILILALSLFPFVNLTTGEAPSLSSNTKFPVIVPPLLLSLLVVKDEIFVVLVPILEVLDVILPAFVVIELELLLMLVVLVPILVVLLPILVALLVILLACVSVIVVVLPANAVVEVVPRTMYLFVLP